MRRLNGTRNAQAVIERPRAVIVATETGRPRFRHEYRYLVRGTPRGTLFLTRQDLVEHTTVTPGSLRKARSFHHHKVMSQNVPHSSFKVRTFVRLSGRLLSTSDYVVQRRTASKEKGAFLCFPKTPTSSSITSPAATPPPPSGKGNPSSCAGTSRSWRKWHASDGLAHWP